MRKTSLAATAAILISLSVNPAWANVPATKAENGFLLNSFGKTLYTNSADSPGKSMCETGCPGWVPFRPAPEDTGGGDWSVITRSDGSRQWAYKSMPVYTFNRDLAGRPTVGHNEPGWTRIPAS